MSRWALLKSSLVDQKRDVSSNNSIHRFDGFRLIKKKKVPWSGFVLDFTDESVKPDQLLERCYEYMEWTDSTECVARISINSNTDIGTVKALLEKSNVRERCEGNETSELYIKHESYVTLLKKCDYWCYSLNTTHTDEHLIVQIFTREKPKECGMSVKGLLSNKLHNVDNTGNVCVWPAEPMLLHTLLTVPKYTDLVRGKRVLEIGGGMAALAGLGLAACQGLCKEIVVTDGHPDCVKNQSVCIEMCDQKRKTKDTNEEVTVSTQSPTASPRIIRSQLLHWSPTLNAAQTSALTENYSEGFDVVIASDCLFFKDYHDDLCNTLKVLLKPEGVGIFLQPRRDGTLQRFVDVCTRTGLFSTEIEEDYSPEVSVLREEYLSRREELAYDEDIHYPVMLVLRPATQLGKQHT